MRNNILITNTGELVNPDFNQNVFIKADVTTGQAGSSLFTNQVTLEFFNSITQSANGLYVPTTASVVRTGLSGTVTISVWSSENSPYPVALTEDTIDISNSCILQWSGITYSLDIECEDIVGADYINILVDRN